MSWHTLSRPSYLHKSAHHPWEGSKQYIDWQKQISFYSFAWTESQHGLVTVPRCSQ